MKRLMKYFDRSAWRFTMSITAVFLLLSLITSQTTFVFSSRSIQENVLRLGLNRCNEAADVLNGLIAQANGVSIAMALDNEAYLLALDGYLNNEEKIKTVYSIQKRLENHVTLYNFIHSAYYYYPIIDSILTRTTFCNNIFAETQFVNAETASVGDALRLQRHKTEGTVLFFDYAQNTETVIMITRPLHYGRQAAYAVVNIDEKAIYEAVAESLDSSSEQINLIFEFNEGTQLPEGYLLGQVVPFEKDQQKWFRIAQALPDVDVALCWEVPLESLYSQYEGLQHTFVWFSIVAALVCIGLSFVVTAVAWKPVQLMYVSILERLPSRITSRPEPTDRLKELDCIFNSLLHDNQAFRNRLAEVEPKARDYALFEVLFRSNRQEDQLRETLVSNGIEFSKPDYQLFLLEFTPKDAHDISALYTETARKYLEETVAQQYDCHIIQPRYNMLVLMLNYDARLLSIQQVIRQITETVETIREKSGCNIALGISDTTQKLSEIWQIFAQINDLLRYQHHFGKNAVIHYDAINPHEKPTGTIPLAKVQAVADTVRSGHPEALESLFREVQIWLEENAKDSFICRQMLLRMDEHLNGALLDIATEDAMAAVKKHQVKMGSSEDNLIETFASVKEFADTACKLYQERWQSKNQLILKTAQHYIEENSSYELQIEDIALFAHTSVSFLYKVFKEYSNFTPMAYLSYVRISKAAEMLKTTDKKIKEIALECGFVSIQTFNRQFGQQMNCSPREYRLLFADKNAENS